jgi:quercetin 2,3-dioxygenase
MKDSSKGKIFLSGEKGLSESDWFRSYSTFNFGNYFNEHKMPVGPLYVLNDETLAGGKQFKYVVREPSLIVLLPLVGAISCKLFKKSAQLQAGEALWLFAPKDSMVEINNPYEGQLVNYLQLWLRQPDARYNSGLIPFDVDSNKNRLIEVFHFNAKLSIGKFDGRSEAIYKLEDQKGLFVFVIQGAFEVQNRLLEAKDGLALENVKEIEMEALSDEAILLVLKIPKKS